jgi:phospholipase C
MRTISRWHIIIALIVMLGLGIWQGVPFITSHSARANVQHTATATTPIEHVVIIMQENHSFDNMFGQFPGANGITLPRASNPLRSDYDHSGPASLAAMDGGKMDEFPEQSSVQFTQADIPTYWAYAQQFGLGDNFFSSIASSSLPNHMAMVAAQSGGVDTTVNNQGCGSIQNMLLYSRNTVGNQYWAYPCYSINSLPQLLNANSVSWRYYASVAVWNPPQLIQGIYGSPN